VGDSMKSFTKVQVDNIHQKKSLRIALYTFIPGRNVGPRRVTEDPEAECSKNI